MNVLSIDWDYFFPDSQEYDWGHSEESLYFLELAWNLRGNNKTMDGKKTAINYFVPNKKYMKDFWNTVLPQGPAKYAQLFIAETHSDIYRILKYYENITLWNYDAHHDILYYGLKQDCSNWVYHLQKKKKIKSYNLVYPEWRDNPNKQEHLNTKVKFKHNTHYGLCKPEIDFTFIFICRSPAFTPSWSDNHWINFISYFKQFPRIWQEKITADTALSKRWYDKKTDDSISDAFKKIGTKEVTQHAATA